MYMEIIDYPDQILRPAARAVREPPSDKQVKVWRQERIGRCIAHLLRDRSVARAVAESVSAARHEVGVPDGDPVPQRSHWLGAGTVRGKG